MKLSPNHIGTFYRVASTSTRQLNRSSRAILPIKSTVTASIIGSTTSSVSTSREMSDFPVQKSEDEWRAILSPAQFKVLREKGTERPGTGEYEHNKDEGT
jgi:hypothetical protein